MRFYQLIYETNSLSYDDKDKQSNQYTEWFGSERDAVIRRAALFKTGTIVGLKRKQTIDPIDVPTDKAGLLKFLQSNIIIPVIV